MQGGAPRVLAQRFELLSLLGRGGMGEVHRARDRVIGREVAVKLLPDELLFDPEQVATLRDEATSLAALHHPNIVQLYDLYVEPDGAFLVMELVRGESVEARLERERRLAVAQVVDFARQTLSALSAAHARGIVHRDIKPANLLLHAVPLRGDMLKVLDFGVAKLLSGAQARAPTMEGVLVGTPAFMAPEQANAGRVDARTDLHAVGLCLYTMLTGVNPFVATTRTETLRRVREHVPPHLERVRPEVPRAVAAAVMRALAKDPAGRHASAEELAADLDPARTDASRAGAIDSGATPSSDALATTMLATPTPKRSPSLGARRASIRLFVGSALGALVVGGAAIGWTLRRPVVETKATDAGARVDAESPLLASRDASAEASATSEADAGAAGSATTSAVARVHGGQARPRGTCACFPLRGDDVQGSGMRLAAAPRTPLSCQCGLASDIVCPAPNMESRACFDARAVVTTYGAPCQGYEMRSATPRTSTYTECTWMGDQDVFAGPDGAACEGWRYDGKKSPGLVTCYRKGR